MMERLSLTGIPMQPRPADDEKIRVNPINLNEKSDIANQFDNKNLQQKNPLKKEKVEEIVKGLNDFLQPIHTSLRFKLHEKLNTYYVAIIDDNTNEVIKEIPPKKLLDTYAAMAEHLGLLVDKKI